VVPKNIQIPYALFLKTVEFLDIIDISEYNQHIQEEYFDVLFALAAKQRTIELRCAYSHIVNAENDDDRHEARMRYLFERTPKTRTPPAFLTLFSHSTRACTPLSPNRAVNARFSLYLRWCALFWAIFARLFQDNYSGNTRPFAPGD